MELSATISESMQNAWQISAAQPLPEMERVCFLPMLWSSHVHSRLAPRLGLSGGLWRMRRMEIKECMTGSADGGYSVLGAMQLRMQITYARERGQTAAL